MLANQGGLEPFFDQPLARPRDRVDTALQGRRDLAVAPALTTLRGIGFQQDPGLQQLLCWMVSAMDKGGEMLSLLIAQCHYVFLYRDLFPGHQSAPSAATEPSNQTNTADSMTGATRDTRRMSESAKVFADRGTPDQWRVEWFDDDGRCELEIFTGPTARRDALRYAMHKYGHFKEEQLEPYPRS